MHVGGDYIGYAMNFDYFYVPACTCLQDNTSQNLVVKAVDGRKLPAVTVFSAALNYIKKITLKYLNEQIEHPNRSILWILTVPAIWSPTAK